VPASTGATWVPIIAMELMEGGSLRDAQRRSRATVGRSLEIAADILDALGASHSAGIVHRDIKPGNVLFTSDGRVKVADFGTACSVSETLESEAESSTVTGTVHYMAPEQARGLPADQRSDLYAVGCLLYELVVGRPPFTGDSAISVSYQQVTRCPERPSTLDPGLPSVMDSVLERALEKDPDHRYQTAAEMRADIVAARRELGGVSSLGRRGVSLPQAEMPRVGHPDALLGWRADSLGPLA
jgi:serine/threonine protein kinase